MIEVFSIWKILEKNIIIDIIINIDLIIQVKLTIIHNNDFIIQHILYNIFIIQLDYH